MYIEGLTEEKINNVEEALILLKKGARNKHVGSTYMNIESSRSHSIFLIKIKN